MFSNTMLTSYKIKQTFIEIGVISQIQYEY